jgi:hypothetical protein
VWSIRGSSHLDIPDQPSRWEKFLEAEHLDEKDLKKKNPKVLDFVVKNHRTYFVPTKILKMYGMKIEA